MHHSSLEAGGCVWGKVVGEVGRGTHTRFELARGVQALSKRTSICILRDTMHA